MNKIARTNLRYELQAFLDGELSTFGVQRLYLFSKQTPNILKWYEELPSKQKPRNLNALFYARYRVSKNLILDGRGLGVVVSEHSTLLDVLRSQDEEIVKANFTKALSGPSLSENSVYYAALFPQNPELAENFKVLEKTFFLTLSNTDRRESTDVWERFVMHNNESLRYCQKRLGRDVFRLESPSSKMRIIASKNGFQFGAIAGVLQLVSVIVQKFI